MKPTRKKIRDRVLELSRKGESTHKIGARVRISRETTRKIIKQWSTPKYPLMKPKYGRPRSLSESDEKYIAKKASTEEGSKLADLQQVIKELNKSVTNKTVKMMLRRHEVEPRSKPKKPLLLPRHFKTTAKEYTYVKRGQLLRECNIIPTTKQGKEAIMTILDEGFIGILERYGMDKDKVVFQHDSALITPSQLKHGCEIAM
ncbi:uncharacterized protein VTP21DRAFT_6200 [Calcarisporiella thermophila]|uniref:uncharacterized protein n=1 Tax=Calcarisporiella thermophila TaxID=911321 RepID=UPI00374258EA